MRKRSTGTAAAVTAVTAAIVSALAGGCGEHVGGACTTAVDLEGRWQLAEATDVRGALDLAGREVTFVVEGDRVSGTSACNHYSGEVTVDGGSVDVTGLGGTEMGCEPSVMELEQRYLAALGTVEAARRSGGTLTLTGTELRLTFTEEPPVEDAPLVGTVWMLESLIEGETAASTSAEATLTLRPDGRLSGTTGCRGYDATYQRDGAVVRVGDLSSDPAAGVCAPDVEAQDRHVLGVLRAGFTAHVEGPTLTVLDGTGDGLRFLAR